MERLWERSRVGQKETNSEAEYREPEHSMGNQAEAEGEDGDPRGEPSSK